MKQPRSTAWARASRTGRIWCTRPPWRCSPGWQLTHTASCRPVSAGRPGPSRRNPSSNSVTGSAPHACSWQCTGPTICEAASRPCTSRRPTTATSHPPSQPPRRLGRSRFLAQHQHPPRPHLPQQPHPAASHRRRHRPGRQRRVQRQPEQQHQRPHGPGAGPPLPEPGQYQQPGAGPVIHGRKAGSIPTARRSTSGAPTARASRPARTRTRRR